MARDEKGVTIHELYQNFKFQINCHGANDEIFMS
jgi:hypothetical protein